MTNFKPPIVLRNKHLQTILASLGPRRYLVKKTAYELINNSQVHTLECGEGIRLQGVYSQQPTDSKGLVIIIHGWLGNSNSLYLLSAANELYQNGYSVFRLNLRDHGETTHLNEELFNSARLDEVNKAISQIQALFPHQSNYLIGFSLGGNFCLRIAANAKKYNLQLTKVIAICPVINPSKTNKNLHDGLFIYHNYFLKKWQKSLSKKLEFFPSLNYKHVLKKLKTLNAMNEYFVPHHTQYKSVEDYLQAYAIDGNYLANVTTPCHIISSVDDPVIDITDLKLLAKNNNITTEVTQYGGHCGFIKDFKFNSWIDKKLLLLLSNQSKVVD